MKTFRYARMSAIMSGRDMAMLAIGSVGGRKVFRVIDIARVMVMKNHILIAFFHLYFIRIAMRTKAMVKENMMSMRVIWVEFWCRS